jgi:hypothetical protein
VERGVPKENVDLGQLLVEAVQTGLLLAREQGLPEGFVGWLHPIDLK